MRKLLTIAALVLLACWTLAAAASSNPRAADKPRHYWLRSVDLNGRHARTFFTSPLDSNDEYSLKGWFLDLTPSGKRALMTRWTARDSDNGNSTLYVADIHGRSGRAVTTAFDFHPEGAWSPDGKRFFYYTIDPALSSCDFAFWSAAPDGSDIQRLGSGLSFAWGPGHNSFATIEGCFRPGSPPGRIVYTDPSRTRHLISTEAAFGGFSISPRGDRIAYTTYGLSWPNTSYVLHVARIDGGGDLASIPDAVSPAWSPNGKQLAFIRPWRAGWDAGALFITDANGSHGRTIIPWGRTRKGLAAYAVRGATWSPNGRRIAYFSGTGFEPWTAIETSRANGSDARVVARKTAKRTQLSNFWWAPDSHHLYYDSYG